MPSPYRQDIRFLPFSTTSLPELAAGDSANLVAHPTDGRQLKYIDEYMRSSDLACQTVAVEENYIDRDHMEDHAIFYSRSLFPYSNRCKRIHFFAGSQTEVESTISEILRTAGFGKKSDYETACRKFSKEMYLGFMVVRPLPASPVGRTVLKTYPQGGGSATRSFECAREYKLHFHGLKLRIYGLAFQQQDIGVSACATTALWSSLSKISDVEHITAATPAQITLLASRNSLPFGRAFPSEGLSLDQMCQSVQAVGVSPYLLRVAAPSQAGPRATSDASDLAAVTRSYLHSVTSSGLPSILVLERSGGRHAVTVVGMRKIPLRTNRRGMADRSEELQALYVHDDRLGPYVRANIELKPQHISLAIRTSVSPEAYERWTLTHLLVPMHAKVRYSFASLHEFALTTRTLVHALCDITGASKRRGSGPVVVVDTSIQLAASYVEKLLLSRDVSDASSLAIATKAVLPRYVGVVRLAGRAFDPIDIVVDSTSTPRNVHIVAVVPHSRTRQLTSLLLYQLNARFNVTPVAPELQAV